MILENQIETSVRLLEFVMRYFNSHGNKVRLVIEIPVCAADPFVTGGAPEISEQFRYFVETAREAGSHVYDRKSLTIIETKPMPTCP